MVVAGASGGIGQPLALLLKHNPLVTHLALYDIAPVTPGVAVDLSHMNTPSKVTGHVGSDQLGDAIKCKKKLKFYIQIGGNDSEWEGKCYVITLIHIT